MLCIGTLIGGIVGSQAIVALLDNVYNYHEDVGVLHIMVALILLGSVVGMTISILIRKMQQTNPADILRAE